ncbi:MAG TPA: TGS domain-containing protein [Ktedonobacterales bacterium]|nr:TGS domain-containing protein [Ktedonobacterales bacterium]
MSNVFATPPTESSSGSAAAFVDEGRLLRAVEAYLRPADVAHVHRVLEYAHVLYGAQPASAASGGDAHGSAASASPPRRWDLEYVISVAQTLADAIHVDAISLAAVLLYQAVEGGLTTLDAVAAYLGGDDFATSVVETIVSIERFDTLQRPGAALRRSALGASDTEELSRERRRSKERQRQQDAENLRKMFIAMAEDPRVAVFKIADELRTMRLVRRAADEWRARAGQPTSEVNGAAVSTPPDVAAPRWSEDECRMLASEARDIYAPLAGRLGMSRVEGELEDLAFAILEPDDYRWLNEAVAEYTQERGSYVERVVSILRDEMAAIGLRAEVTGRVKHLWSIYKKVQRSGSHDLSNLYDVLAFRILVDTVADCYLALGHVHALWRPKDGRIKDFIATPKPNGYQSLHTTVFCLDDRLAEIQIRTHQMHEVAEYGVAMHWYYKDVGDSASAQARSLQTWIQQLKEWQQEFQAPGKETASRTLEAVKGDVLNKEQIFVFTPNGDVKELPAGSTPLDFAYLIHTDVGNHVAGARVSSSDSTGRLVKKLVPLDYELKSGDVVEILKRKDAHPTRDWLHVARTKTARNRILRYLKEHERDIDIQIGRERLDRELKTLGLRKGYDDISEDDLEWLAKAFEQPDEDALLAAIGNDKLRLSTVGAKLRERLFPAPVLTEPVEPAPRAVVSDVEVGVSVAGMNGLLTQLANCCDPLPGDPLLGYISRGRGVVIHRADCLNLAHLLEKQPERAVAVEWPKQLDGDVTFRAPIVIEAADRTGLLADVMGVISGMKINMLKVTTVTKPSQHRATITATLEISHPEQLSAIIKALEQVASVQTVKRKETNQANGGHHRS